jgi:predicted GTPase
VDDRIEKFSVLRAKMAVERADVCILVIDANEGITEQDEKIAGLAHEAGKATIVAVNKWDLVEKDNTTTSAFTKKINNALGYMTYAPVLFISAKTGETLGADSGMKSVDIWENRYFLQRQEGLVTEYIFTADDGSQKCFHPKNGAAVYSLLSMNAVAIPVTRLVAPGPLVARQTPTFPVALE